MNNLKSLSSIESSLTTSFDTSIISHKPGGVSEVGKDINKTGQITVGTPMPSSDPENGWIYSYCTNCVQSDCSLKVYLKGGRVQYLEGNPESPINRGKACLRSISSIMGLYNPYRVKTPMKRTNSEKGIDVDPGWVEISWDEALDTVASRFKKIRQSDPRKLAVWWGFGAPESAIITARGSEKPGAGENIFTKAFGTPNMIFSRPLCSIHYACNLVHAQSPESISDLQLCQYLIAPGRTIGPNVATTHGSRRFIEAIERGLKLVVVDPRFSPEASKAYRWLPIRPGTDLAFALSMIYVIFYEIKKFDQWSVKNRTNGPYLIGPDGYYVRDSSTGKPLIWDPADSRTKTFDDPSVKDYALEGEYILAGLSARPALQIIKEQMKEYTPEWAESITTIPAQTIREVTGEFVEHAHIGSTINIEGFEFPFRPAHFAGSGRGAMSHKNGTYFDLAGKIINLLVGSLEVPGGLTGNRGQGPQILKPDSDGIVTSIGEAIGVPFKYPPDHVGGSEFYPHAHALPHILARTVLDPEKYYLPYELEAMLVCGSNPIRATSDREMMIEAFRRVPFTVSFAFNFDETAVMSDILLPDHHFLERRYAKFYGLPMITHQNIDDGIRGLVAAVGRNPVKPLYNTRLMDDVLIEIADRAGFLKGPGGLNDYMNTGFRLEDKNRLDLDEKYTMDDIFDRRIKQLFGEQYSFEFLLRHGVMYRYDTPGKLGFNYYYWPGNTTRFPIYFNKLKESGDTMRANLRKYNISIPALKDNEDYFRYYQPVPQWTDNYEGDIPSEYDLWACSWKTNFMPFGTGDTQENAWLSEVRQNDPYEQYIWINTGTAREKGLKDEDRVCVESPYGKTRGKLRVTELIHPEVIGIPACYGSSTPLMCPYAREGPHFNSLISGEQNTQIDPVHGGINIGPKVKVYLDKGKDNG
jgi:anaerobic selenocysteine-containing dehydrogenase